MLAATDLTVSTAPSARPSAPSFDQSLSDTIDRLVTLRDNTAPGFRRRLLCWRLRWHERRIPTDQPSIRTIAADLPEMLEEATA
jgi:hypothetical protein